MKDKKDNPLWKKCKFAMYVVWPDKTPKDKPGLNTSPYCSIEKNNLKRIPKCLKKKCKDYCEFK